MNVGIATVVEFLQKKGYTVEANPNTKISEEQYAILVKEFSTDKNLRLESERFIQERQNKDRNKASVSIEGFEKQQEKPKSEDVIKTVVPEDARPKFKPVGKIDLDKLNRKPVVEKVEEKKVEEQEVVFLMDRFGYAKTIDVAAYERNKEAADSENRYVLHCMNTGKICIFTNTGQMHLLKVVDLPFGKFRDKGQPIDNVSNYDSSKEQLIYITDLALSLIHI